MKKNYKNCTSEWLFVLFFVLIIQFGGLAQSGFNGAITYTPPRGQDGCIYSVQAGVSISLPTGKFGIDVDCTQQVTAVKAVVFQGKTYSASQLPNDIVQNYLNAVNSDYINLHFTVVAGAISKRYSCGNVGVIDWNSLLGKSFSHDSNVQLAIQNEGKSLYENNQIKITNVAIEHTIPFDAQAIAAHLEEKKAKNQQANTPPAKNEQAVNSNSKSTSNDSKTAAISDDFWNDGPATNKKQANSQPREKSNEEVAANSKQSVQKQTDDFWKEKAASDVKAKELGAKYEQSFYTANLLRDAKDNLDEVTTLNAENYATVEELEAAFRQKMSSINNAVSEVSNAKNQQLQANVEVMWANSNPSDQAVGDFVAAAGSIINSIGEEKRKREAKDQLEIDKNKAKAAMEAEIAAEKRRLKLELRNYFMGEFKDGGVPLSSHKVASDELYFFSFIFDQNTIANDTPVIYLTGVFPMARYKDGTWPFKNNLVNEIKKLAMPGTVTLMGYYTTEAMATQTRSTFVNMANQSGFVLKDIVYKGKKSSGAKAEGDFWETNKKSGETKTDTDFWETPNKTTETKSNKKETKKDDFWND